MEVRPRHRAAQYGSIFSTENPGIKAVSTDFGRCFVETCAFEWKTRWSRPLSGRTIMAIMVGQ
jgi:hypothetical protein